MESGAPNVAIGTAFNAAFTTGVNLFSLEGDELALARRQPRALDQAMGRLCRSR